MNHATHSSPISAAPRGRARRAFTLIEVMIAFAIFAMSAVVLGSAYVNILNGYLAMSRTNTPEDDARFARALLLAEPDHDKAQEGGDYDAGNGRHVRWKATIESTNLPDLQNVTFTCEISDPGQKDPTVVTQVFRVLRPTWSDPTERGKLRADTRDRILQIQGQKK